MSHSTLQVTSSENLSMADARLYAVTAFLVAGNLLLPMAVHSIPNAGRVLMPIFFFTLIAGWRFGLQTALLTAVLSPVANNLLTGMPPTPKLLGIVASSALLAGLATLVASRFRASLASITLVVFLHRVLGLLPLCLAAGPAVALQALSMSWISIPGHVVGAWVFLKMMERDAE